MALTLRQAHEVVFWLLHGARHEPCLVAIDGYSAAGKSTLSRLIAASVGRCQVVAGDDFYRVMAPDRRAALSAEAGYAEYFDWQRLEAQVLRPLRAGRPARFQVYEWEHNRLGDWKRVAPEGVIVVEGVYSTRPELVGYYDATLYVEAPREARQLRQRARGDAWEWVERWEAAEAYYMQRHGTRARADVVFVAA
jgi:uridine kinase